MDAVLTALAPSAADALPALCRRFHVRQLDLIGSAADGRFDPARSDLDFVVEFEEDARLPWFGEYFRLRDGLADLFGREVDLLTEPALENPYLRRAIESQRKRVFSAD